MGDLEPYMDEYFVTQAFKMVGQEPINVKIIRNKLTGLPQGYCFVDFQTEEQAFYCLHNINSCVIPNTTPPKNFNLRPAIHGGGAGLRTQQDYSLYVSELSDDVTDSVLFQAFSRKYPSCVSAKVVCDQQRRSRGFGFVKFTDEKDQQVALIEMQGASGIGRRHIRISLATPRRMQHHDQTSSSAGHAAQVSTAAVPQYAQYNAGSYNQYGTWQWYNQYLQYSYGKHTETGTEYTHSHNSYDPAMPTEDDEDIVNHNIEINTEKENSELIERCEDLYVALEDSRWQHYESVK